MIDQYKPVVVTLHRSEKGAWEMISTIGIEKSVYLSSIDIYVKMKDIYRNATGLNAPQFRLDI